MYFHPRRNTWVFEIGLVLIIKPVNEGVRYCCNQLDLIILQQSLITSWIFIAKRSRRFFMFVDGGFDIETLLLVRFWNPYDLYIFFLFGVLYVKKIILG